MIYQYCSSSLFNRLLTVFLIWTFVTSAVQAQYDDPSRAIESYRTARDAVVKDILKDLQGNNEVSNNWPLSHINKIYEGIAKLQNEHNYKVTGSTKPTAHVQNWTDWVNREELIWGGINKELKSCAAIHNEIYEQRDRISSEIKKNRQVTKRYGSLAQRANLFFLKQKKIRKGYIKAGPFIEAIVTIGDKLVESVSIPNNGGAFSQFNNNFLAYLKLLDDVDLDIEEYERSLVIFKNTFSRDLKGAIEDLEIQTSNLNKKISKLETDGLRVINRKLVRYSGLKSAPEIKLYAEFDKACDNSLRESIKNYVELQSIWQEVVDDFNNEVYERHANIKDFFNDDYSNSSRVFRDLDEWYDEFEDQHNELLELKEQIMDKVED
jgi:hypothetical protein